VYIAGVDLGLVEMLRVLRKAIHGKKGGYIGNGIVHDFVNFGGRYLGGGMSTGDLEDGTDILSSDWVSVEIRFGPGKQQKRTGSGAARRWAGVPRKIIFTGIMSMYRLKPGIPKTTAS